MFRKKIINLHDRPTGGHFSKETVANKILRVGSYRITLFKNAHTYVKKM